MSAFAFAGAIDEFRIWSDVLDATSIGQLNDNVCITGDQPVHDYQFEVGVPGGNNAGLTTLPDLAGMNPGTLTGFSLNGSTSNWVAAPRGGCNAFDLGVSASTAPDPVDPGGQVTS